MNKKEYARAIREAKRIFGYIRITETKRQAVRLSKVKALALVGQVTDDDTINAMWASDDQSFLLVG